ncbi:hypothetical protein SNE40_018964 [Patella caerulea]|uniref:Uncharacterized protein n=1 Tax=Patella caerulea TaxID=87958 RepID=A0AAN8P8U0_PATCE
MPAPEQPGTRLLTKEFKGNIGPCMISFSIPLLIPGLTITLVAFSDETGFSKYGELHILGMVVLVIALLLFFLGCVFRCFFQIIRIVPLDNETLTSVTTHDKLDKLKWNGKDNPSVQSQTKIADNNQTIYASTSTSSRDQNQNRKKPVTEQDNLSYSSSGTGSYTSESDTDNPNEEYTETQKNKHNLETLIREKNKNTHSLSKDSGGERVHLDPSIDTQDDSDVNTDLYPLKRLPKIDLKHTKFSYSSQDKPDEEMSILDETNGASPDEHTSAKRHLGDLPDLNGGTGRRMLSDGSYDTTSVTSTDSISGHIIRTDRGIYHAGTDSENF